MKIEDIEFRVWDKFNGQYWYSRKFNALASFFAAMQNLIDGDNELVFERPTGLKDNNEKDCYESDVVGEYCLTGDFENGFEPTGKVYFDTDLSAFCVELTNGGWEYLHKYLSENKKAEVIGNIHENPELLTK